MSSQAVPAVAGRTLRHWTIDSRKSAEGSQRPAPALPYSEEPDGGPFHLLASKLAVVKSELARRVS
jgi:hypothetical protein